MHEFSVAEAILDALERRLSGPKPLASVALTIGRMSGICAESLRFCIEAIARERGFGSPELVIRQAPARFRCAGCGREYDLDDAMQPCPHCASLARTVLGGHELTLDGAEYEEE